jgi:hypothetical protein
MNTFWKDPAPTKREIPVVTITAAEALAVAEKTLELIDSQGCVFWKCQVLRDQIIQVVADMKYARQSEFPIYTLEEMRLLNEVPDSSIRLVYAAKKLCGGAQVISVEDAKEKKSDAE